ncbi:hypothetical protein EBZ80_10860 [bacterium]|nr:hypothetical protein [bacterium]
MRSWSNDILALVLALMPGFLLAFGPGRAMACASCGSGGDDPLVLFPAESLKIYAGATVTPTLASTGPDGEILTSSGPDRRATTTVAAGVALSRRAFLTVSDAIVSNARGDASRSGPGDPVLSGRYTLVMPQLAQPLVPQVQLLGGYRPAIATSIHDATDANLLDVFGSGFDEWRAGFDVWFGMFPVKPGFALIMTESIPARHNDILLQPGRLYRATTSLTGVAELPFLDGSTWPLKIAAGLTNDQRGPALQDGDSVPASRQSATGAFASADVGVSSSGNIKVSLARQGIAGRIRNAVASTSWTVAWSSVLR